MSCLASGLFLTGIALSLLSSFRFVNLESTVVLLIFNVLFVSLAFQLNGKFSLKLGLLALGNLMGFLWNFTFNSFALAGVASVGETFNNFYIIIYPFMNSFWIVSFWSLSLTFLRSYKGR